MLYYYIKFNENEIGLGCTCLTMDSIYIIYDGTTDDFESNPPKKDAIYKTKDDKYFQIIHGKINEEFALIDVNNQPNWNDDESIEYEDINTFFMNYIPLHNLPKVENATSVKISQKVYDSLMEQITFDHCVYLDENSQPQLRHRLTKYDASTKQWIPDNDAIQNDKIQNLKSQAQQELDKTHHYEMDSYKATCSDEENKKNLGYRILLHKILKNQYNGTELPKNPNIEE